MSDSIPPLLKTSLSDKVVDLVMSCVDNDSNLDKEALEEAFKKMKYSTDPKNRRYSLACNLGRHIGTNGFPRCSTSLITFSTLLVTTIACLHKILTQTKLNQFRSPSKINNPGVWNVLAKSLKWDKGKLLLEDTDVPAYKRGLDTDRGLWLKLRNQTTIFEEVYQCAAAHMKAYTKATNNPYLEQQFLRRYSEHKVPTKCFLNSYCGRGVTGIDAHVDHVKYVTVIVGIEETEEDGKLNPLQVEGTPVPLGAGRMAAFGRVSHSVPLVKRKGRRITLNCFF